ncbi:MAG TPA: kelch repeat-containing protein [Blastocatellia bacterium]|nr:kelch repeat-containing protein [Blastocatellia bacterium]HMY71379.1 kelch repeat-containing protein [Blastocatellia bacterium]HMZ17143.1 kelch repeat-containing protein [Blastocatellia bacterium]HNG33851.1 kelch repeat-containing protein [Blastocatellia bacterium]
MLFLLLVFSLALAGRSRWTGSAGVAPGLGAWNAAGVMNTARSTHTATRLNDGRVLVASGRSLAGQTTKSAEIYDPATDRWTPTGDLVEARLGHSALLLKDGRVLVVGFQSAEVFDPAMGKWALTGDMAVKAPSAASNDGASVTLLANGKVLVAGGRSGVLSSARNGAELFDPITGMWTATGTLNYARNNHTATLLANGKVLIAGGINRLDVPPFAELYDPVTGTFTTTANLNGRVAAQLPNGRLLLIGGDSGRAAELYDPATGSRSTTGSLNFAHTPLNATLLPNGNLLIVDSRSEVYDLMSGQWSVVTNPLLPRQGSLTVLQNGKVLLAGGTNSEGPVRSVELFDPSGSPTPGAWNLMTARLARQGHTATTLTDGRVLVAGGGVYSPLSRTITITPNAQVFDPGKNWQDAGNLNVTRQNHSATLLANGQVLVVGGESETNTSLLSAEIFNPSLNNWLITAPLSLPRRQHQAVLLNNGNVLVAGGANDSNEIGSAEIYDPVFGRWSLTGAMTAARRFHTLTLLADGKVLAVGGEMGGTAIAGAEVYDSATGIWRATGALQTARRRHTATRLPNGKVLITGGVGTANALLASAEIYDPVTGTWRAAGTLNFARQNHTATLLSDGRVLIAGGTDDSGRLNSAEIFDPAAAGGIGLFLNTGWLSAQREMHTANRLADGKVLVVGGINGASPLDRPVNTVAQVEIFDPSLTLIPVAPVRIAPVSAASFRGGDQAADSIIAIFGERFTDTTAVATTSPLPVRLGGVSVAAQRLGVNIPLYLFFASPNQVNVQLSTPLFQQLGTGPTTLVLTTSTGLEITEPLNIVPVLPSLFTINASGNGLPAAVVLRVKTNGEQVYEPVARFDQAQNRFVAIPIDLSNANEQVFLILYGTGIKFRSSLSAVNANIGGASAEVVYAGVQGDFAGLDQINLRLPRSLAGRGDVDVQVMADGLAANTVKVNVK